MKKMLAATNDSITCIITESRHVKKIVHETLCSMTCSKMCLSHKITKNTWKCDIWLVAPYVSKFMRYYFLLNYEESQEIPCILI